MSKKSRKKKSASKEKSDVVRKRGTISVKRFAPVYVGLMGTFFVLIGFKPVQNIVDLNGICTTGVVIATSTVLRMAGISSSYQGSVISLPSIALDVKFGCNGLEAVMIYSVAVIAFSSPWRKRLLGILAGFVVIQTVNILRIAGLAYWGVNFRQIFDNIHIYVAQGMMMRSHSVSSSISTMRETIQRLRNKWLVLQAVLIFLVSYAFFLFAWIQVKNAYGIAVTVTASKLLTAVRGVSWEGAVRLGNTVEATFSPLSRPDMLVVIPVNTSSYMFNAPLNFSVMAALWLFI